MASAPVVLPRFVHLWITWGKAVDECLKRVDDTLGFCGISGFAEGLKELLARGIYQFAGFGVLFETTKV